jgi:chromosome segregation ATPase
LEGHIERLKSQLRDLQQNKEELGATLAGKMTQEEEEGRLVKGLERETETLRDKNAFLQLTISQLETKVQSKQTEVERMSQEVGRLNTLLTNLAAQREEMLNAERNLRATEGPSRASSEQLALFNEENQRLREQLGALLEAERMFKSRFAALDSAKDRVQETCDERTFEVEQLGIQLEKHLKTLRILADEKTKIEQIAHELSFKCTSMENDLGCMSKDMAAAKEELRLATDRLAKAEREKADMSSDFQMLLMENRTAVNDCMMLAKKVESLEKRVESRQEEIKRRDVEGSNLSIEVFQLKNSCKMFEQENFSLKKLVEKAQQSFQDAAKRVKSLERELESARYETQSLDKENDSLKVELSSMQASYNKAMVEIQSRDVGRLDNDQEIRILRARCETSENVTCKLNKELGAREKALTKLINDHNALQQNFLLIKSKNEELVAKFAVEMRKNAELETSLPEERSRKDHLLVSLGKTGRSLAHSGQSHLA